MKDLAPADDLALPLLDRDQLTLQQVVLLGKALSDPIRVRMLSLMAAGRGCCGLPPVSSLEIPGTDEPGGICVCEFQDRYGLGQSKVSYHLRILKEAGLVTEESRGKWTFYGVNKKAVRQVLELFRQELRLDG